MHELVHVMQQAHAVEGFATSRAKPGLELDNPGSGAEQEATRTANWIRYQAAGYAPTRPQVTPTAGVALQRAPEDDWDKVYGTRETRSGMSYVEYKKSLGQVKATTEGGLEKKGTQVSSPGGQGFLGHKAAPEIKWEVFLRIYPGLAQDVQESPVKATSGQPAAAAKGQAEREAQDKAVREQRKAQAQEYLASLNQAFKIMKIDTVEAQANYLAHAYVESDQFRQFTETQGSITLKEGTQKWRTQMAPLTVGKYGQLEQNPAEGEFRVNRAYLESTYNSEADAEAKERKRTVNPGGKFEFIGRGPVQVTHNYNYLEVIAMLERTAEQYEEDAHKYAHLMQGGDKQAEKQYQEAAASAGLAREAAQAIKGDPTQAANPKYTFLFSAAYMKKKRADVAVAGANPDEKWTGEDPGSNWVAGAKQTQKAQVEALGTKQAAYKRIYGILLDEARSSGAIP